jgi:hypothetical protein
MKATTMGYVHRAVMLVAVLLTAGVFAGVSNAQSDFRGKFTLPYEVQWGKAVLQPGSYLLSFNHDSAQRLAVVRDAKNDVVALEPTVNREDSEAGKSVLLIGTRGKRRVVFLLRIAPFGKAFVYDPALAQASATEEAGKTQTIPVTVAKK